MQGQHNTSTPLISPAIVHQSLQQSPTPPATTRHHLQHLQPGRHLSSSSSSANLELANVMHHNVTEEANCHPTDVIDEEDFYF